MRLPLLHSTHLLPILCIVFLGCAGPENKTKFEVPNEPPDAPAGPDLKIEDLKEGTGEPAKKGDRIVVHYTGWLTDGTKFDSSVDRQEPYPLHLGYDPVIQGWHKGIAGMKAGGKRRLTIPPELAYGKSGREGIPPNATLVFEIDLLRIQP